VKRSIGHRQDVGTYFIIGQADDAVTEASVVFAILHPDDGSGSIQLYFPIRSADVVGYRGCTGSRKGRILCWCGESWFRSCLDGSRGGIGAGADADVIRLNRCSPWFSYSQSSTGELSRIG